MTNIIIEEQLAHLRHQEHLADARQRQELRRAYEGSTLPAGSGNWLRDRWKAALAFLRRNGSGNPRRSEG